MKHPLLFAAVLCFLVSLSGCGAKEPPPSITVTESPASNPPDTPDQKGEPPSQEEIPSYPSYLVDITINPFTQVLSCVETITYRNTANTSMDQLLLNVYANAYSADSSRVPFPDGLQSAVYQNTTDYSRFQIQSLTLDNYPVSYSLSDTTLRIVPKYPLPPGEEVEIKLMFEAYVPQISHKLGGNADALWFGGFLPTLAVFDGHSFTSAPYYPVGAPFYSEIANYDVTVSLPASYELIAPGVTAVSEHDGSYTISASCRMVRDFTFAVAKGYQSDTIKTEDGVSITLYHKTGTKAAVDAILDEAKADTEFYSQKVGSYPYHSLYLLECELAGSQDAAFSQMVFLDSALLNAPTPAALKDLHIGYQWMPQAVGVPPSSESWLFEGAIHFLNALQDTAPALESRMEEVYRELAQRLEESPMPPLSASIGEYSSLESYEALYQNRSMLFFYRLYQEMGEEDFFQALRAFYAQYSFRLATGRDFASVCAQFSKKDLSPLFEEWTKQAALPPLS